MDAGSGQHCVSSPGTSTPGGEGGSGRSGRVGEEEERHSKSPQHQFPMASKGGQGFRAIPT
jgi:hypothetical protein